MCRIACSTGARSRIGERRFSGAPQSAQKKQPSVLYLRVPSVNSEEFRKAENLACIFDGAFRVCYYDSEKKTYIKRTGGIVLSDYLLKEFKTLLGTENVVLK